MRIRDGKIRLRDKHPGSATLVAGVPLVLDVLTVAALPDFDGVPVDVSAIALIPSVAGVFAIAFIPSVVGVSAVGFIPAVAGVSAVAGVPAVDGVLAVVSLPILCVPPTFGAGERLTRWVGGKLQ